MPPRPLDGNGSEAAAILDAADHALPETGPVRLGRRERAAEHALQAAELVGFLLAAAAGLEVTGGRLGLAWIQRSVQVCSDAAPRPVAGQHGRWTTPPA